ncbi:MAG: hypothetical protein IJW18_05015 [Lachnospiraceae bacterium]|nr:hypothetical protein [Lachnospiraceae bacterium]
MDYILSESTTPVEKKSFGINLFTLKIIAFLIMLCDLICAFIIETHIIDLTTLTANGSTGGAEPIYLADLILRLVGSVAFPLFCFFIVQGFLNTSNIKMYIIRLAACAVVTEFIWDLASGYPLLDMSSQNPLFTLLIGLVVIFFVDKYKGQLMQQSLFVAIGAILCNFINAQFGTLGYGVFLIVLMYGTRNKKLYFNLFGPLLTLIGGTFEGYLLGLIAFVFIALYNGKRGPKLTYVFYLSYPVTLLALHFIGMYLF